MLLCGMKGMAEGVKALSSETGVPEDKVCAAAGWWGLRSLSGGLSGVWGGEVGASRGLGAGGGLGCS
eukprot:7279106-Prymnesium_polylepis.1